jgi:hypothetical protein
MAVSAGNWPEIQRWIDQSASLFIKKLSRNDCRWADGAVYGHQNGLYVPREIREIGFFPTLRNVNSDKPHIFEAPLPTLWPAAGETKLSRLKHYSNKGHELHLTGVPKNEFAGLTPASLLIAGTLREEVASCRYWLMTIDSGSEEAELIESVFDLGVDFHYGLFDPRDALKTPKDESEALIEELGAFYRAGNLAQFIASVSKLPPPHQLASEAQNLYAQAHNLSSLDPYTMPNPGDAIMQISRDIEYALYKRAELRHRAAEVLRILTVGTTDIVEAIIRGFPALDATFLSASQHRKSRAGRSFEQHIARLLTDGGVSFQEQAVTGGRRPDFVLPSLVKLKSRTRSFDEAMVLSAKTTLRERWKQIAMEKFNAALFLATVDDRVSSEAIDDMGREGICMVVPESLKASKETCYTGKDNVITFRRFFDEEIAAKRPGLRGPRPVVLLHTAAPVDDLFGGQ